MSEQIIFLIIALACAIKVIWDLWEISEFMRFNAVELYVYLLLLTETITVLFTRNFLPFTATNFCNWFLKIPLNTFNLVLSKKNSLKSMFIRLILLVNFSYKSLECCKFSIDTRLFVTVNVLFYISIKRFIHLLWY